MKTLGLLGGMSWESTLPYYRMINETVRERRSGLHSAPIILYSVDFHAIERRQQTGDWAEAGHVLARAARALEAAGADGLVLCTNTMHRVASAIEAKVTIPLLHIADPTAAAIRRAGLTTVGLLGHPVYDGAGLLPGPADRTAWTDGHHSQPSGSGDHSPGH